MPAKCKQRERILASGGADVPALPLGAVRGHLCFRCFEHSEKILKCGGCRRAGYCSQDCQKLDWSAMHKTQCKILKRINEEDLKDYSDSRTWAEYRRCLVNILTVMIANINSKQNRLNTVIWCRS
jgi:splicing suppressor protein 51